jgi:hypothetical protein
VCTEPAKQRQVPLRSEMQLRTQRVAVGRIPLHLSTQPTLNYCLSIAIFCHPIVVSQRRRVRDQFVLNVSCCLISFPLVQNPMILSSITCRFPLSSICENRLSAIAFAAREALWPSGNSTSYTLVSRIGLSFAVPIGSRSLSLNRLVTLALRHLAGVPTPY